MDTLNAKALAVFTARCDELISSKFIVADKKISMVLKSIAASRMLYELFQRCAEDFDFDIVFENSKYVQNGKKMIIVPTDAEQMLAYDFCLLMELDSKSIDLHKLLNDYFKCDGGIEESFVLFAEKIIIPFKLMTIFIVEKIAAEELKSLNVEDEELDDTGKELLEFASKLKRHSFDQKFFKGLDERKKEEILQIFNEFIASIMTFDKKIIMGMLTGFKNTLKLYKRNLDICKFAEEELMEIFD